MIHLIVSIDVSYASADREPDFLNPKTISPSTKESYNAFIYQQENQRRRDRRNRVRTGCIDHCKRKTSPILTENNNLNLVHVHESTIHHCFKASTSNEKHSIFPIQNYEEVLAY